MAAAFQCSEHALGAEDHVPDALASDCVVVRRTGGPDGNLASLYSGDGTRNEDWFSWGEPLLAPFGGVVLLVSINPESTVPGVRGQGRSSAILFRRGLEEDPLAVQVAYVHVRDVLVSAGDTVRAGQPVARIGNNGSSFHPHVRVPCRASILTRVIAGSTATAGRRRSRRRAGSSRPTLDRRRAPPATRKRSRAPNRAGVTRW
jgi:hypothetical protein